MKGIFTILLICFFANLSLGQGSLEKRLTKKVVDCEDIVPNSADLFINFLFKEQ